MGCVVKELPGLLEGPDGERPIVFLYNPEADDFVSLAGYDPDDYVSPLEIDAWERRLDMQIPRGY